MRAGKVRTIGLSNETPYGVHEFVRLADAHGLSPTRMALGFCCTKWQVASTIIGVTSRAQLDEDLDAWGTTLAPELLQEIDAIRWELCDPAL